MYYLQSRYYDPSVCRFVNEDNLDIIGLDISILKWNIFAYCENEPIKRIDPNGCDWYQYYYGFKKTSVGFNLYVNRKFLSQDFCLKYAHAFLNANGTWHWYGRTYSGMNALRIAQELWFHAVVYYVGMPIKKILKAIGISWALLNGMLDSAEYMEINSNDKRAWIFKLAWYAGFIIINKIRSTKTIPYVIRINVTL